MAQCLMRTCGRHLGMPLHESYLACQCLGQRHLEMIYDEEPLLTRSCPQKQQLYLGGATK